MSSISTTVVDPLMFGATLAQFGICSTGLVINGFLVYTILRNKQLRSSPCFLLILALAVWDCLCEFSIVTVPTTLTLTGRTIPLLACFYMEGYGAFALMNAYLVLLMISLDRLYSIALPLGYKTVSIYHSGKYLCLLFALPLSMSLYFVMGIFYPFVLTEPEKQVFCQQTDFLGPIGYVYGFYLIMLANIGTFAVYSSIWLLIKCKIVKMVQSSVEQRLLQSLYVLMALTFFCWLPAPVLTTFVFPNLQISAEAQSVSVRVVLQLNKLAQAANGLVLFFCSSQYRLAMQKELGRIFGIEWTSSSNRVININSNNNNAQRNNMATTKVHVNPKRCPTDASRGHT